MKMLVAIVVSVVLVGAAHAKVELVSKKMLRSTEETKIDPNQVSNMSFLSRTLQSCNLGDGDVACERLLEAALTSRSWAVKSLA